MEKFDGREEPIHILEYFSLSISLKYQPLLTPHIACPVNRHLLGLTPLEICQRLAPTFSHKLSVFRTPRLYIKTVMVDFESGCSLFLLYKVGIHCLSHAWPEPCIHTRLRVCYQIFLFSFLKSFVCQYDSSNHVHFNTVYTFWAIIKSFYSHDDNNYKIFI